jgi:hypothetical protein
VLLADPSDETIAAADEVVRLENEVRALGLKRQREEALDWFRQREAEEEAEAADLDAEAEAYRAEQEARERRHIFQTRWLEYALSAIAGDAQGEVEMTIHHGVKAVLEALDGDESEFVVRRIVDGVVAKVLRPWRRQVEVEEVVTAAVGKLPYWLRGIAERTEWEVRAATQARAAIDRLRPGAAREEMEAAAEDAVKGVEAEHNTARAIEADSVQRERLLMWLPIELREFTEEGQKAARDAVQRAWESLPVGTSRDTLTRVRDTALAPFRAALVQRKEAQQLAAEAARKRELEAVGAQMRRVATPALRTPVQRAGTDPKRHLLGQQRLGG